MTANVPQNVRQNVRQIVPSQDNTNANRRQLNHARGNHSDNLGASASSPAKVSSFLATPMPTSARPRHTP